MERWSVVALMLAVIAAPSGATARADRQPHACLQSREWQEVQRSESRDLTQRRRPRWTRRTAWKVVEGGRTHMFAVGKAEARSRQLGRVEAEAQARGEFAEAFGRRTEDGFETRGAAPVPIDHYRDQGRRTDYALVCLSR